MGISSDEIFVFGFSLGLEDEHPPFLKDDSEDFANFLGRLAGLPEWSNQWTQDEASSYFAKKRTLEEACPAELVLHCSFDYPMWIMAVRGTKRSASRGYPEIISKDDLVVSDERVAAAKDWCVQNGIEWKEPSRILASLYG